jgi:acetyl-CoA carboxylase biotin carboxyl carrier protein
MEFKQIKELISLVNSTDLTDVEIEAADFRLRIRKEQEKPNPGPVQIVPETATLGVQVRSEPAAEHRDGLIEVVAPMVGTFYRAPAPDADPFIRVGETITQGQTLFIIEAMKMMNEIESEVKGMVKQVLVENGEPVEYGQPLLLIDPKA